MKIVLYDYRELEERDHHQLKVWKVCHIILYAAIAVFGLFNYTFLDNTKQFVDGHCVFSPHKLAFHDVEVELPRERKQLTAESNAQDNGDNVTEIAQYAQESNKTIDDDSNQSNKTEDEDRRDKREVMRRYRNETREAEITMEEGNTTMLIGNYEYRRVLDTVKTFFRKDEDCQYSEYMPIMSSIFAMIWMVIFTMCPSGGRSRSGLQQPWRVLAPALLFAVILVILTGISFTQTNRGIQEFCAAFLNETNTTACSAVDGHLPVSNSSVGFGHTASLARAASAAVWATWACAAALMLARCLRAADFAVRRTEVYLKSDRGQKITPHLKRSPRKSQPSSPASHKLPSSLDDTSVKSEPTCTSQLVFASLEQGPPASLSAMTDEQNGGESLEMTYAPQEPQRRHD